MAIADIISRQTIDLANDTLYCFEVAPQGDGRSRYCDITITNNGVPVDVSGASTIVVEGKNAGGYVIFNKCTIPSGSTNVIRVPYSEGILSFAGLGTYRIEIDGICSFNFNVYVTECPYDVVRLQASDSYEALSDLVKNAGDFNKWIVGDGDPNYALLTSANDNDLYFDMSDGDVFQKITSSSTGIPSWILKTNLMIKTYIRYAYSADYSDMTDDPTKFVSPKYARYIGFCFTTRNKAPEVKYTDAGGTVQAAYTYNGNSINYNWSLYRDGVVSYLTEYVTSTSGTTIPTSGWTTTIPTLTPGNYLWTRMTYTYDDGKTSIFYSVAKQGVSLSKITVNYAVGTDATTTPTSGWATTIPSVGENKYLWTRYQTYSDKNGTDTLVSTSYTVSIRGMAIKEAKLAYMTSTTPTPSTTESDWTIDPAPKDIPVAKPNQYLITRTQLYSNDGTLISTTYSTSKQGVSISKITVDYAVNTSPTTEPTTGWSTSLPTVNPGEYLWTRWQVYSDKDGTDTLISTSYSVLYQGISISDIKSEYYRDLQGVITGGTDPSQIPSTGWVSTIPSLDPGDYLWIKFTPIADNGAERTSSYAVYENVKAGTWSAGHGGLTIDYTTDPTTGLVVTQTGVAGIVGDMYLNIDTANVYRCTKTGDATTALWVFTEGNLKGPKGSKWYSGTDLSGTTSGIHLPSGTSSIDYLKDDYYLNTNTGYVYVCTTAGQGSAAIWDYSTSIKGIQGDKGDRGSKWYNGSQSPDAYGNINDSQFTSDPPIVGDLYLENIASGTFYRCDSIDSTKTGYQAYHWVIAGSVIPTSAGNMNTADYVDSTTATKAVYMATKLSGSNLYTKTVGNSDTSVVFTIPSDSQIYSCKILLSDPSIIILSQVIDNTNNTLTLNFAKHTNGFSAAVELIMRNDVAVV